jgi:Cytosine/adenosine deaminases
MFQARLALRTNETPVGCVLVYKNRVIARGMNATNITRNGTRHAELMAICALLSYQADWGTRSGPGETNNNISATKQPLADKTNQERLDDDDNETSSWGDVDPTKGHLYPYGQKLHPAPRVSPDIIKECTLYVTVEPCVMCASLLRQLGIKRVYFGAVNDKFGGTGGVFRIHKNSPRVPASAPITPAPHHPISRPVPEPRSVSTAELSEKDGGSENGNALESNSGDSVSGDSTSGDNKSREVKTYEIRNIPFVPTTLPGDGGNIEPGYEVEGGWGRDEAITLLRQFYVQENNRGQYIPYFASESTVR